MKGENDFARAVALGETCLRRGLGGIAGELGVLGWYTASGARVGVEGLNSDAIPRICLPLGTTGCFVASLATGERFLTGIMTLGDDTLRGLDAAVPMFSLFFILDLTGDILGVISMSRNGENTLVFSAELTTRRWARLP